MIKLETGAMGLWQWNTQQRIITDYLPGTVFDFSQDGTDALERTAYQVGSRTMVDIPNAILQLSGTLSVYAHVIVAGQLTTVLEAEILVKAQPKPRNYINDEEEIQVWHALDERITVLEQGGATDPEEQMVLIEQIGPTAGQHLIEKVAEPDGTAYDFRAIHVAVTTLASEDPAKNLTVTLGWSTGDQDAFRFGPVKDQTCSVYMECKGGVKGGSFSVRKNGTVEARTVDAMPADAVVTSVRIEAGGEGFAAGSSVEIQAIQQMFKGLT